MECTSVYDDFEEAAMRNSLIADTTLSDCSIAGSVFDNVSSSYDFFHHRAFSDVESPTEAGVYRLLCN